MRTPPKSSARLLCCLAITLTVFAIVASVPASAGTGAAFTTFDVATGGCLDGNNPNGIDCNNYDSKDHVYVSGGPIAGSLGAGCYYFSVLVPGFQNGGFIDGADGNLSDTTVGSTTGDLGSGDAAGNRAFRVTSTGDILYPDTTCDPTSGGHALGTQPKTGKTIIQLKPYDDTSNMGGVYIAAICSIGATSPSQCKFDAFRIKTTSTCTSDCGQPTQGTVSVCKFWDQNFDHTWDNNEPFIGAWPINATITGGDGATLDPSSKDTDNTVVGGVPGEGFGCTTFTVTFPLSTSPAATVTLSEGNAPDSSASPVSQSCDIADQTCQTTPTATWTQSAPFDGTKVLTSEDVPVSPSQNVQADNFGNFYGQDLTVSKTATPYFTRTYAWDITKCATDPGANQTCQQNPPHVDQAGGNVTFNYTIVASETGFVDSAWSVTGNITVTNPNGFDVTGVSVTDAVNDGGNCSVTDTNTGSNETVPANGTLVVPYSCTYGSAPTPPITGDLNTATASWNATTFATPHSSAEGTKGFAFTTPTTSVNKTVTVTDCFNGCLVNGVKTPTTLGTLTAVDTTPYTTATYHPTHTVSAPANGCKSYTNVATVVLPTNPPVNPTASATVTVCGPERTGALTMGFWQNKNGQGIISGQAKTGVCPSGTWLRQFAPFQDLSSTATCAQVATYVYNVIKAATCGGSTCNAMLKPQMLSTALDVYFSDPSLGGNKIGAPGPIGGDLIDLTQVCKMIDGSGGTATCSGSFEDAATAFGGPATGPFSLTVLQMLLYENNVSNIGGTVWYGQVKATQVLAKDAFDAINNGVAFAP